MVPGYIISIGGSVMRRRRRSFRGGRRRSRGFGRRRRGAAGRRRRSARSPLRQRIGWRM